jgi:hypothetical protein
MYFQYVILCRLIISCADKRWCPSTYSQVLPFWLDQYQHFIMTDKSSPSKPVILLLSQYPETCIQVTYSITLLQTFQFSV